MLCFLLLIFAQFLLINAQSNDCETPGGNHGRCVLVRDCPFIRKLHAAVLTAEDNQYVLRFKCGMQRGSRKPLVCCPELKSAPDCGRITLQNNIIGGVDTEPSEFPWTVQLAYNKNGRPLIRCGGSLINDRYVLTAAHCVVDIRSWELKAVRLGEWDTTTIVDCKEEDTGEKTCNRFPHRDILVEKIIPHELYNRLSRVQEHDIALLMLAKAAPKTDAISPICLPTSEMFKALRVDTTQFTVAGWGATNGTGEEASYQPSSTRKQKVTLPGQLLARCREAYGKTNNTRLNFTDNQLCVGGVKGKDSCRGDSGGPLMVIMESRWHLAGIVSFGTVVCGMEGMPGIYTKMGAYLDWVADKIEEEAREMELKGGR